MYIVCEYAICVLAVWIGATTVFAAYVISLLLIEGGKILAQILPRLRDTTPPVATQPDGG
jgi:hypothetical protein